MYKYLVTLEWSYRETVEIEADNADEAEDIAIASVDDYITFDPAEPTYAAVELIGYGDISPVI